MPCPTLPAHPEAPLATAGGQVTPSTPIACRTLHAIVPAGCCILRQAASRGAGRTLDTWRGQAALFPSCTASCAQGAAVRAAVSGSELVRWRGGGPGGRFERGRSDAEEQYRARKLLEQRGLLAPVPSMDQPPGAEEPPPLASISPD